MEESKGHAMTAPSPCRPGSGKASVMADPGADRLGLAARRARLVRRLRVAPSSSSAIERVRTCACALVLACASSLAVSSSAHPLSLQECLEGGDFIAHAAEARDNGMSKAAFLDRLVADVYAIQAFPPELRWFVVDPEDAEFLTSQASEVFDRPKLPEAHRADFLSQCFDR